MELSVKDVEGTFHTRVAPKGKATIARLEKEIKENRKGKTRDSLTREGDWVTDPGATQPRESLYHKMMEMVWKTKMLIGKVSSKREDVRQESSKEHTKLLNEVLRHLSRLETIIKMLTEVKKD
jgi:hypothetical protein